MSEQAPTFVHYDYSHWREIWRSIRHAMIGEVEIKRHGKTYLPKPEGMDNDQYRAYLDRAPFYNMVYRTVTGLTGSIFRRDPRLLNAGPLLSKRAERISKDGLSLPIFTKVIAQEMLSPGRYGVLVDKAASGDVTEPYLAPYTCENILDWTTTEIDGMTEVDYVLLREFKVDRRLMVIAGTKTAANSNYGQLFVSYRVLRLTYNDETARWEYHQEFYSRDDEDADLTETPVISIPLVFGVPMKRIPFRFFNATTNLPDVEKPPVLDILTLNMHHYKVYAQLQHARYFTSNPVYYVSGAGEDDTYHIGPSVVWEIGAGEKAGIIEYSGRGLDSLEKGIEVLENQVASLGGRLIGDSGSAGQSDNQIKLKDRNEQSLLLNVTTVINENMTALLRIVADWMNESSDKIIFRVNQDFLLDGAAAREFRAVAMMHKDGQLPVDIFYEYFLKSEVIPEYVDLATFKAMLEDAEQFPKVTVNVVPSVKLDEFREKNISLAQQIETTGPILARIKEIAGDDLDAFTNDLNGLRDIAKRVSDGELKTNDQIEAAVSDRIKAVKDGYEDNAKALREANKALEQKATTFEQRLIRTQIDKEVTTVVIQPDSGVRPEALPDVLTRAYNLFKVEDGKLVPKNGEAVIYGANGADPMTVSEWIVKLRNEAPHYFKGNNGGGAAGGKDGKIGGFTQEQIAKMSPQQKLAIANAQKK